MFSSKTEIVSSRTKKLEGTNSFSSYIGKKVYSKSGEMIGTVKDVIMKNDIMLGVLVHRVFIGKEFFKSYTADAIMLKIDPVTNLLGKQVYDSAGDRVGKVVELNRKSTGNSFYELRVKKNIYSRSVFINKKDIEIAKKNVILKKPWQDKKK
jgi:sporulation protein YlmC with PRC-barrel domain